MSKGNSFRACCLDHILYSKTPFNSLQHTFGVRAHFQDQTHLLMSSKDIQINLLQLSVLFTQPLCIFIGRALSDLLSCLLAYNVWISTSPCSLKTMKPIMVLMRCWTWKQPEGWWYYLLLGFQPSSASSSSFLISFHLFADKPYSELGKLTVFCFVNCYCHFEN